MDPNPIDPSNRNRYFYCSTINKYSECYYVAPLSEMFFLTRNETNGNTCEETVEETPVEENPVDGEPTGDS